jgi:molecular chaperone GrpE (heat shock protein)
MKRPSLGTNNKDNNNYNIPPVSGNVLFNSYQKGNPSHSTTVTSGGYQPPIFYAKDQTTILEDTTRAYYETDETANKVLNTLLSQRQQLQNTDTTIHNMHSTTQQVSKEIELLRKKYKQKKQQLYMYIAALSIIDILLFLRMIQCHGNFYCW